MYQELLRMELVELRSAYLSGIERVELVEQRSAYVEEIAEGGISGTEECICIRNF